MRKVLCALVLAGALLAGQARAQSASAPADLWCYTINVWATVEVCSSATFQQCLQARSSASDRCYMNPKYAQARPRER